MREALISLEIGGLVEVRVGSGVFVTAGSSSHRPGGDKGPGPFELLSARTLVEGEVAALAAVQRNGEDLEALGQSIDRMTTHVDDFVIREESDREFHLGIAKATGNGSLELVVEGLWNQRAELWGRMQQHFHTEALAQPHHSRSCGDPGGDCGARSDAARTAMHRHLARVVREFQRGVNSKGKATTKTGRPARSAATAVHRQRRSGMSAVSKQQMGKGGRRWILRSACSVRPQLVPLTRHACVPQRPVTLNIVDVAGNLALTQEAIDNYVKKNPDKISKVNLHEGARSGTARQAEGHAGCRTQRHRPRDDGHRFPGCGHRPGRADEGPAGPGGEVPQPRGELPAGRREDAGTRAGLRRGGRLHAGRSAASNTTRPRSSSRRRHRPNCWRGARPTRIA